MKCGSAHEAQVLRWVAQQAQLVLAAKRVILYGSRARGDADERLDFDIAIDTDCPDKIPDFLDILEHNPITLLGFDVVVLASVTEDFRARILAEGRDITDDE